MKRQRLIVWFRQDLRVHDNEALTDALRCAEEVIPVYIFDERVFMGKTKFGFPKTGAHRAQFIIDSVKDLRQSLKDLGCNLLVRVGKPEEILFKLANELKTSWVFCNRERTSEEIKVQDALEKKLWSIGQEIIYSRGKMLYYTQDLPFPVTHTPDTFTQFRKEVEKFVPIRKPLPLPVKEDFKPIMVALDYGRIPEIEDFGLEPVEENDQVSIKFKGGEKAGKERLNYYLWETDAIKEYKETRNNLLGADYSSKLSPWLAQGCLSPKYIYHEIKRYEEERTKNDSTYWLGMELMWRDFFRLMGKKYEEKIFLKGGIKEDINPSWKNDRTLFEIWAEGRTGIPFIDANMRELNQTGFMSNRGRQNVASFLVKDLKVNWQMGAAYFESRLIDYDPCSNWGNWNYVAGVGSDPREDRYFNILSQARRYDAEGNYVRHWISELKKIPGKKIHFPDELSEEELATYQVRLGVDYPRPMIHSNKWSV